MKTYIKHQFEYFYDKYQRQWVMYPVDNQGERVEWDKNDNPIECTYFNNIKEINTFFTNIEK
jgi:hypothetical protein